MADAAAAEQFGPYRIYERLGVGGMATVDRAGERGDDSGLGFERIVALKRLLPHLAADASFIKAFVREAKLASALSHVNIVQIYELGRVGGHYFISMEYIDGHDVRHILRRARKVTGPPPIGITIGLLLQLCDALDYAHSKVDDDGRPMGLVHRDVSPSNLLVTSAGHLKVIDFGIAKAQSSHLRTQTGRVKGKLAYMAPEAIAGREADARSDLFAAGVIAHELLTARPLFASPNEYQTMMNVQRAEVVPPSRWNPTCPAELDALVLNVLARDPAARPASASALRDRLHLVRRAHGWQATAAEIASWCTWAFAQDVPSGPTGVMTFSGTATPSIASAVTAPAPELETEPPEDPVDGIWGSTVIDTGAAVILDDVPDVSARQAMAADATQIEMRAADADVDVDADADADETVMMRAASKAPNTKRGVQPARAAMRTPLVAPRMLSQLPLPATPLPTAPPAVVAPPARKSRAGVWIVLGVLGVAGVAGVAYAVRGRDRTPIATAPVPAPAPVHSRATTAMLKIVTEPADAEVRVGSAAPHAGTPWSVELPAGDQQLEIRREGYKAYLTAIEITGGEPQTLRVVLERLGRAPALTPDATLALSSSPLGLEAIVDGAPLAAPTPIKIAIAPGVHTIVLRDRGVAVWTKTITAIASSNYELAPVITARRQPRRAPYPCRTRSRARRSGAR